MHLTTAGKMTVLQLVTFFAFHLVAKQFVLKRDHTDLFFGKPHKKSLALYTDVSV
jgi:hypothetical protein